ncbi:hypothetical protein [Sinorhizobium americanum]|uniref:Phage-related protein n=1 Tax=Sinorhizobium americanum TaxID=194963 RepID=A0A1L3LLZ2_9HYPH|nr:hypothetical protein [Sinorhizobium americanum]APG91105.1 phage-related protein [Sinorhizobium americanum]
MADRPILFSGPMVQSLLAGRKTQTRRLIKPQPTAPYLENGDWWDETVPGAATPMVVKAYVGDRLWVKETHARVGDNGDDHMACPDLTKLVYYRADDVQPELSRWRSSIFMRRQDSRLTLIVTDVRVERLQDISEDDAAAEGWPAPEQRARTGIAEIKDAYPIGWYAWLWDQINGAGAWDANPWVAAYTFTVIKQNIDQVDSERTESRPAASSIETTNKQLDALQRTRKLTGRA